MMKTEVWACPVRTDAKNRDSELGDHQHPSIAVQRVVAECRVSTGRIVKAVDVVCDPGMGVSGNTIIPIGSN